MEPSKGLVYGTQGYRDTRQILGVNTDINE